MKFIHLHNHTDYSILEGIITIEKLISRTLDMGMPGVAITDHGNMFGAIEFYEKAVKSGIKPIIGQEFYVAPSSRFEKSSYNNVMDTSNHLILIAKDNTGYKNIMRLSSIGYLEGFCHMPRIDFETLEKYSKGLICLSACIKGQIPHLLIEGKKKEASEAAARFNELFGNDSFYLEIMDHGISDQKKANSGLIELSKMLNIPLVATNNCHYLNQKDAYAHELWLSIQTGKTIKDEERIKFPSDQLYFKSPEEMYRLFSDYPESLKNTLRIMDMTDLKLSLGEFILPHFEAPDGFTIDTYLKHLVYEGAKERYSINIPDNITKRIEFELSVITNLKFSAYFLIVWDLIRYARQKNIPVGPGRGSSSGSIICYCLKITDIDPLRYNLLFERFINPDRNEIPDIDIDFCANRREEMFDYVKQKYGEDYVSYINTFRKTTSKSALWDVARVMDIPFQKTYKVNKLIPYLMGIEETFIEVPKFKKLYEKNVNWRRNIDIARTLEGLVRSVGKHAAGIAISKEPMIEHVPLYRNSNDECVSSQFDKDSLEKAGPVKMDFLGLKNLTVIDGCIKHIKDERNIDIDISQIPLDDEKTFKLLQHSNTDGVFQLESSGMKVKLRKLKPTEFEDIIAMVSLYRPGPLNSGLTEDFIKNKNNPKKIKYPHPLLEQILKNTYGLIVYQEQVMQIARAVGGLLMPEADMLRKAIGKKQTEIINEMRDKFLKNAKEKNIDKKAATVIYNAMEEFGQYSFNKSHAVAYALITYRAAYLKANYPEEFRRVMELCDN